MYRALLDFSESSSHFAHVFNQLQVVVPVNIAAGFPVCVRVQGAAPLQSDIKTRQ